MVNNIIENLIDQVDDQVWDTGILEYIVSFRRDPDVDILTGDQACTNFILIHILVINTKGWGLQVKLRDQITDWVPLHLITESNTIEVVEHDMANGYSNEPTFRWWACKVLKKRNRLVNKVK